MAIATYETETKSHTGEVDFFTVRIRGQVTMEDAAHLREDLMAKIAGAPYQRVVLALGDLDRIDSAGAAVLVEAVLHGRETGKRVLLCSPSETVIKTFRLAGLTEAFDSCCPTSDVTWKRLHE